MNIKLSTAAAIGAHLDTATEFPTAELPLLHEMEERAGERRRIGSKLIWSLPETGSPLPLLRRGRGRKPTVAVSRCAAAVARLATTIDTWLRRHFRTPFIATLVYGIATMVSVPAQVLIRPSETDPAIVQYDDAHYVYLNKQVPPRGQLFVFLPGTLCTPSLYTKVVETASNLGFHAIGLMYVNLSAVKGLCSNGSDPACFEQVRLEIIDGTERTSLVAVDRPNSIENRLIKLLLLLASRNPDDNWGQYLDAQTNLVWPKIVISGHSQGAGHAGIIAKYHPVARSVMFAAADFWTTGSRPADWILQPGVTPAHLYFGFMHASDGSIPYSWARPVWTALGLDQFGPPVVVETNAAPYQGSHEIITKLQPRDGFYHGATAQDTSIPLQPDRVTPVYEPVWRFMLVGPPILPRIQLDSPTNGMVQISFGTLSGYSYQLQEASALGGTWKDSSAAIPGDGSPKAIMLKASGGQAFYRVAVPY